MPMDRLGRFCIFLLSTSYSVTRRIYRTTGIVLTVCERQRSRCRLL